MLGGDGCAAEVLFDAADAVDGSYVINHVSLVDPAGDAFRKEYAEKYNGAKMELNGYMAHDAYAALVRGGRRRPAAMTRRPSPTRTLRSRSRAWPARLRSTAEDRDPVGKSGCVERIDGENKTYVFEDRTSPLGSARPPETERASTLSTLGRPARGGSRG